MDIKKMFSIVIPTYNRRDLLERCLSSLLNQDYPRNKYEIIVVDDCSKDNTKELVKKLQLKNKNIRYIRHEKNKGVAAARNTGIKNSKYDSLIFIDDDCITLNNYLKKLDSIIKNKKISCLVGEISLNYNNTITKTIHLNFKQSITNNKYLYTSNLFVRKKVFNKIGLFDEKLRRGGDTEFDYRVNKYFKIYYNKDLIVKHNHKYNLRNFYNYNKNVGKSLYLINKTNGEFNLIYFFMGGLYDSIKDTFPKNIYLFPNYLFGIIIVRFFYFYEYLRESLFSFH